MVPVGVGACSLAISVFGCVGERDLIICSCPAAPPTHTHIRTHHLGLSSEQGAKHYVEGKTREESVK